MSKLLVCEVMTSPVIGIKPNASLADAARLMLASKISGLPVIREDEQFVGVITEGDFLQRVELGTTQQRPGWLEFLTGSGKDAADYVHSHGRKVEEVMSPNPVTVSPETSIDDVVELMISNKIKRVLVVKEGEVVGIVARSDLMKAVLQIMPDAKTEAGNDKNIQNAIVDELRCHRWSRQIRISVHAGVVEYYGTIFDERIREAARVAAENVAGVKDIIDHMVYIEPITGIYLGSADERS